MQHPTTPTQQEFIEVNSDRNSTNTGASTTSGQNRMKPVRETNSPQDSQFYRTDNQMTNNWTSIWANRSVEMANSPVDTDVNSYSVQQETVIQDEGQAAAGTWRIDNSSSLYPREIHLNNTYFSNNQPSFRDTYQTQFNFSRQPESIAFEPIGMNYNSSLEETFHFGQTNLSERVINQPHSLYQEPSLRHDQLHSDFLNREMLDFDTDLVESGEEQSSNADISANFTESQDIELEPSKEVSQFSSSNVEVNYANQSCFSLGEVYSEASNQTPYVQLEQSNHSVEFQSQFYEKSVGPDKMREQKEIWNEQGNESTEQINNNQNNKKEENVCVTALHENWVFIPDDAIIPDEARRLRLTSSGNIEPDPLCVMEDVNVNNVMNQVDNTNNYNVSGGPFVFGNQEEALFYESRIKEIDAIDSALSIVEKKMEIDSNCYDLDSTSTKNIETFQHIGYNKGDNESFIPGTTEFTVMALTIQPGDSPLPPETEDPGQSSQPLDLVEEMEGSNIPVSSTGFEMEPCQESSSRREIDQLSDEAAIANEASSTEPSSFSEIQQTEPCSTSTYNLQSENVLEKTSEDELGGVNLQTMTPDNAIIRLDDKKNPNTENKSAINSEVEERSHTERGTESIIPESMNITDQPSTNRPEHLLGSETEVRSKNEIPSSTGELPGTNVLEFSGELVMNRDEGETENNKSFNEQPSAEYLSTELSAVPQMHITLSNSSDSTQDENIQRKELEDENVGVSLESAESATAEENLHRESEIQETKEIDSDLSLNEKNTSKDSNADLRSSISTENIETKIGQNDEGTETVIQVQESVDIPPPSAVVTEYQLPSDKTLQESSDKEMPTRELSEPNTSETPILVMNPSGKTGSQSETKKDKSPKEGTSIEIISTEPSLLSQIQKTENSSTYSAQGDKKPEKGSEDEHEVVSLESARPNHRIEIETDIATNQIIDKNADEPSVSDQDKENPDQETKLKGSEEMNLTSCLNQQIKQIDLSCSTSTKSTEKTNRNIEEETVAALPTGTRPENQILSEIKTQNTSEIQYNAGESSEPNISELSTVSEMSPIEKTGQLSEKNVCQPPKEESSAMGPSCSLAQTQQILIHDEPTIDDNVEIHISPSALAWLSEPDTQTTFRSQPCTEQLENYKIEQGPLPTAEDLSGIFLSEQLGDPSTSEVSGTVEQKEASEGSANPKVEHISTEVAPKPVNDNDHPPQSTISGPSAHELTEVSFESEPSISCVGSEPSTSVEGEDQQIASEDGAPPAKKKRTESKPIMKLRVKETRKSTRVKKHPERLFYIGKGQLF
ncbi:uro-adherence factor A [Halyomorpha halys]|uniref:uro-adherence factor A n=1 Tax=Halyomorpha halys TaxID=286706 RepID=UPI0006D50399|nr:uncharacterized protein LOC106686447 [Halyomorpha halys]XP_014285256.1 uncharacterized protein LOC106686447 [Halyomorpha halys]